jgi:putative nucleotidyltransferase with HDIG domain
VNEREKVAWILRDIRTLPTLPHVAMQLMQQSESANSSMAEVAAIVERDPSVTTRLLKLVNSPFFGIRNEVASVHQALILIGMNNLRSLVLSTSVMDLFDQRGQVGGFDRANLWRHSVATGVIARFIARETRGMDPDIAFTAGLIHDIGKVIIDRYLHPEFIKIVNLIEKQDYSMRYAERSVLGVTHNEIGMHLAMHWNLPEVLQECVAYHHEPMEATNYPQAAAIITIANQMAHELNMGYGFFADVSQPASALALAKLTDERAARIVATLAETIEKDVGEVIGENPKHAD